MAYADLFAAASHCQVMREFIILRVGGKQDDASIRELRGMAAAAAVAVEDAECKALTEAIVHLATDLFSDSAHAKWAHGQTSGADFLRLRILREIKAFQDRLAAIEMMRMAAEQHGHLSDIRSGKPR